MLKFIRVCLFAGICIGGMVLPALAGNNSGAAFSTWPDTGQTKCYNDTVEIPCPAEGAPFYGQDAQYNGPARSYTDLGSGMVQDNVTGLIWEQKTNMDGTANYADPHDADNTYTWCDTDVNTNGGNAGTCGANNTMDFLAALNAANYGGHNDWRLPTIKELITLADSGRTDPAIDPVFAATTQGSEVSRYWSSTTLADSSSVAWHVNFTLGYSKIGYDLGNKSTSFYVRAVRGGQTPPAINQFVDNGVTVTDTVTGLEWQKATAGPLTWQEALAYSENLILDGKSDWRLPDRNELRSLVDFSRYIPAIDPLSAATDQADWYWSSTTEYGESVWSVGFNYGFDSNNHKSSSSYVRAVRGGQSGLNPIQRVTSDGLLNAGPHFNHNGSKLTFFSSKAGSNGEIYVINADGTGETRLTDDLDRDYQPHFSPDGTKIVYKSVHDGNSNIWVMNADGSGPHQVTFDTYGEDLSSPPGYGTDWSPDGSKIVFDTMRSGNYDIWIMSADGTNPVQLTTNLNNEIHPHFSPDGSKIVYRSEQSGERAIWIMDADGTNKRKVTPFATNHPHFNYNGTQIGFAYLNKTYLVNADGTGLQEFPYDVNASAAVDWSPDGTKLAYMALGDIWIYSGDMTPPTPIEPNDTDNDGTPDSTDNCPDDPNKTDPGPVGCGILDSSIPENTTDPLVPSPGVTVTFSNGNASGTVSATPNSNPSPPTNFRIVSGQSYEITFSDSFTPPVTVCLAYDKNDVYDESSLKIFHRSPPWEDITSYVDMTTNKVCGLTNSFSEFAVGETDTDLDGMPDSWEITYGLNPNSNDATGDGDGDDLNNLLEYLNNTDPIDDDTDNDGMTDGWEVNYGLNPLVDDATGDFDGDGITNLGEFTGGSDPTVDNTTPPAPTTTTKVPVHNGLWLIPSMLGGLYLLRRRKKPSA